VQASLTGHLVLSTLHTNSALGAISRLQDMGVEPFLLSTSLLAVMSQRLVRRLCPHCRQSQPADAHTAGQMAIARGTPLWRAVGCASVVLPVIADAPGSMNCCGLTIGCAWPSTGEKMN
jgi:general secretion pathway protein E